MPATTSAPSRGSLHTKRPQCPTIKLRFQLQVVTPPPAPPFAAVAASSLYHLHQSRALSLFPFQFVLSVSTSSTCGAIKILQHFLAFCLVTAAVVVIVVAVVAAAFVVSGIWQFLDFSFEFFSF